MSTGTMGLVPPAAGCSLLGFVAPFLALAPAKMRRDILSEIIIPIIKPAMPADSRLC